MREKIFSSEVNLFEGLEDRKLPIYSKEAIQARIFLLVGKMVAYLIVHLDIGVPCPCVYEYITSNYFDEAANHCRLEDICDYEMREVIHKVCSKSMLISLFTPISKKVVDLDNLN